MLWRFIKDDISLTTTSEWQNNVLAGLLKRSVLMEPVLSDLGSASAPSKQGTSFTYKVFKEPEISEQGLTVPLSSELS